MRRRVFGLGLRRRERRFDRGLDLGVDAGAQLPPDLGVGREPASQQPAAKRGMGSWARSSSSSAASSGTSNDRRTANASTAASRARAPAPGPGACGNTPPPRAAPRSSPADRCRPTSTTSRFGKRAHQPRDVAARRLYLDRHRDRVAVVFDHEEHRQAAGAGGRQAFPEFAFAGRRRRRATRRRPRRVRTQLQAVALRPRSAR